MTAPAKKPYWLASALSNPKSVANIGIRDWEVLLWQARNSGLTAQLRHSLHLTGILEQAPQAAIRHMEMAWELSQKHAAAARWELRILAETLKPLNAPVVLLKGAAYCAASNQASFGRLFNDIDILVPKIALPETEELLTVAAWLPARTTAYDERYYREWMHEIPPMEHRDRYTSLDVHHTILPPTAGIPLDPQVLFDAALPIEGEFSSFKMFAPADMVIHSACHLFFDEFHKGLRDLYDLHGLFLEFSEDSAFWQKLMSRAENLGLALPVLYALQQCRRLFGTTIPDDFLSEFQNRNGQRSLENVRQWLFDQVLRPNHSSATSAFTPFAQWLAFVRSHWLKMPMPLLVFHLSHKILLKDK